MIRLRYLIAASATAVVVSSTAPAQVTLTFDDGAQCPGAPLGTQAAWISLLSGVTCQTGGTGTQPFASPNYLLSSGGTLGWTFLQGAVQLTGLWARGQGLYSVDLLKGGSSVWMGIFSLTGSSPQLITTGYSGSIDQVIVQNRSGTQTFGIDNVMFNSPNSNYWSSWLYRPPQPPSDGGGGDGGDDGGYTGGGGGYTGGGGTSDPPTTPPDEELVGASVSPEPATLLLVASGLGACGAALRRRRQKRS